MSLLTPVHRARHILGLLGAFGATVKLPEGGTIMRMERHATALASPSDLAELADMVHGNEATRKLVEWMPEPYTLDDLRQYAPGTLGAVYLDHMERNGLSVDYFPEIPPVRPDEIVRIRLYQTHDIWHCLVGYSTSFEEEMGIVGFYMAQYLHHLHYRGELIASFMGLLASAVVLHGSIFDTKRLRDFMDNLVQGYQRGVQAKCLVGPRWEEMFARPLADIRLEMGITDRVVAPPEMAVA